MIAHVRLVGQCLSCDVCGGKRSLTEWQHPDDSERFGYLYISRREAFEREHQHGVALPELPRSPGFPRRAA